MTTRKPLVTTGGRSRELPAGDTLALFGDLATPDQFADADGDIAEVEAATKALRATLYPIGDNEPVPAFCISRHALGFQVSHAAGTTFTANSEICTIMNLGPNPIALRKLGVSACTSALSGARVGLCRIALNQLQACVGIYNNAALLNPPTSVVNLGAPTGGMKTRQNLPGLIIGNIQNAGAPNGIPGFTANVLSRTFGEATGGAPSAVGTNVKPCWLFDSYGEEPLWLLPTTGLYLNSTFPAAGTSQTVNYAASILWDEWQLRTPR